jgi:hypothetical protein
MNFIDNAVCPISNVKIDGNVSRLTVFINVIFIALYLLTGSPYFMIVIAIDYGIRGIWSQKYSPLRWIAERVARAVGIPVKLVDAAPKLFGARGGFVFAAISVVLIPIAPVASFIVAGVVLIVALLDSVVDLCVGCLTYAYIVLPYYKWRGIR